MTDEANALVERLRERIADTLLAGLPYNRDGDEAADLIETQAREIERLREAMHMAMLELGSHGACPACLNAHSILQNALAGDSHDQ